MPGRRIRARRLELGLSLSDLATRGASATYIGRIERGERNPSIKALRELARRLGVSVHWLETGSDDPAEELARMVLAAPAKCLPPEASEFARRVLELRLACEPA